MNDMVYKITDIQDKLKISKATAYRFARKVYNEQTPFKIVLAGTSLRIVKSSFDDWLDSDVYQIKDIQTILKLSRSGAYSFIENAYQTQEPFQVLKVLTQYRIPKNSFDIWFEQKN